MKRLLSILLALLMVSALFVGCTAPEVAPPSSDATDKPVEQPTKAPATEVEQPPASNIVRGGTLIAGKTSNWSNLNPTKTNARADDRYLIGNVYEPLIGLDASGNFIPQLATSWSMDDTKIELTLRDDVVFHDGTKFNAEAVKFVLEWYMSDDCAYVFRSELNGITSIEVVGDYTVRLNLAEPNASLLGALANVSGYMISPEAIQKEDLSQVAVGTGPFVLKEAISGDHMTFVRNENYYVMGEDGKPLPYLDEVVIKIITDDSVKTTNLVSGDIMLVDYNNSVNSTLTLQSNPDIHTTVTAATDIYSMTFNTSDPILSDIRVRQAILYSIDREEIVQAITEGLGAPAVFLASPNQWFYSDYAPYAYNPEKAKTLLAEAGYADGLELTVRYISREPELTMSQLLQAQMAKSGIHIAIEPMERLAWVEMHSTNQGGQVGLCKYNIPRPDAFIQYHQVFSYITKNCEAYDMYGKALVELLDSCKTTYDVDARKDILVEFQKGYHDSALGGNIYSMSRYTSWNNKLQGIEIRTDGTWDLSATWIKD